MSLDTSSVNVFFRFLSEISTQLKRAFKAGRFLTCRCMHDEVDPQHTRPSDLLESTPVRFVESLDLFPLWDIESIQAERMLCLPMLAHI